MEGKIVLKNLTMEELMGVLGLYPWFGAARKELCRRIGELGGEEVGINQFADAAMYMPSRKILSDIIRSLKDDDYSDKNISDLVKAYVSGTEEMEKFSEIPVKRVAGGDFFTKSEYEKVRIEKDAVFGAFASNVKGQAGSEEYGNTDDIDLFTETLAEIYAEQGYYNKAIAIYSKLILAYPEKNAYFASLIEKLKNL